MGKIRKIVQEGSRYGRLVAIGEPVKYLEFREWRCDCGSVVQKQQCSVVSGQARSCGCLRRETTRNSRTTHGKTSSAEYSVWAGMKARCLNKNSDAYEKYGGRGVSIFPQWEEDFSAFLRDMGARPSMGHTLERIDNDGPYSPENCKWATRKEQSNNRRNCIMVDVEGITMTVKQAAEKHNVNYKTLLDRVKRGVPIMDAISMSPRRGVPTG